MKTILVVDDEPDLEALVRQKFRRKVSASEWRLVFARDGQEALETIAADPTIDLVLTDINMPRMDGLTMLGRLQQTSDPVATIVVSAYGDMTNIRAAMNGGAYDFLTKPIDFSDFEVTVEKILRHVAAARDARERRLAAERSRAALARYFSPKQHTRPESLEALYRLNDVELYDTKVDPVEMNNLAAGTGRNRDLVVAMNDKLNRLIDAEVGEDRGQMLPGGIEAGWEVTPETMAP